MNARPARQSPRRNMLGAIVVALFISTAINGVLQMFVNPLARLLSVLINFLGERVMRGAWESVNAGSPMFMGRFSFLPVLGATALILAALLLTTWLYPEIWRRNPRASH